MALRRLKACGVEDALHKAKARDMKFSVTLGIEIRACKIGDFMF